jgi:hypothetical protein
VSITYGWANPVTGKNERADTQATARRQAWEQLQNCEPSLANCVVYRQEVAGVWTPSGITMDLSPGTDGYAWTDPTDLHRVEYRNIVIDKQEIRELIGSRVPDDGLITCVTYYSQSTAFNVFKFDPEPLPGPAVPALQDRVTTIPDLIAQVEGLTVYETQDILNRALVLANLYQAKALGELSIYFVAYPLSIRSIQQSATRTVNSDLPDSKLTDLKGE